MNVQTDVKNNFSKKRLMLEDAIGVLFFMGTARSHARGGKKAEKRLRDLKHEGLVIDIVAECRMYSQCVQTLSAFFTPVTKLVESLSADDLPVNGYALFGEKSKWKPSDSHTETGEKEVGRSNVSSRPKNGRRFSLCSCE